MNARGILKSLLLEEGYPTDIYDLVDAVYDEGFAEGLGEGSAEAREATLDEVLGDWVCLAQDGHEPRYIQTAADPLDTTAICRCGEVMFRREEGKGFS